MLAADGGRREGSDTDPIAFGINDSELLRLNLFMQAKILK